MILICSECGQAVDVNVFGYGEINPVCEYCGGYLNVPNTQSEQTQEVEGEVA